MPHKTPPHRFVLHALLPLLILAPGLPPLAAGAPADATAMRIIVAGTVSQPTSQPAEDESAVRVIQALDRPVDLNVTDAPILEVLQSLAESADVLIEMETGTLDLLPYGSKTLMSATIEHRSLKESLTALLRPLGLVFEAETDRILIAPTQPLRRMARRATWEELAMLDKLYSTPWSSELFDSLQFQFQDARAGYADANPERLAEATRGVGAGQQAAEVLELACDKYGWAWAPSGDVITIMSKTRAIERQLNKRVTVQYVQISLEQALLDLTRRAGVSMEMEPGALASLPPHVFERFPLFMEAATIRQVLEWICGLTGLSFSIEPNGIRVSGNKVATTSNTPGDGGGGEAAIRALRANVIVGQINIANADGSTFSFFIREDDLPPEVNEMRKAKIRDAINQIRQTLGSEQPKD
ncbi:MAG: hypothetical protein QUV05_14070 [Phycisphaerae bacterium]|nr:hypothetical protein [Phycisphaerae bacterium]